MLIPDKVIETSPEFARANVTLMNIAKFLNAKPDEVIIADKKGTFSNDDNFLRVFEEFIFTEKHMEKSNILLTYPEFEVYVTKDGEYAAVWTNPDGLAWMITKKIFEEYNAWIETYKED